jgi:hypothetical protein
MNSIPHQHQDDRATKDGTTPPAWEKATTRSGRRGRAHRAFEAGTTPVELFTRPLRPLRRWPARIAMGATVASLLVYPLMLAGADETNPPASTNELQEVEELAQARVLSHSNEPEPGDDLKLNNEPARSGNFGETNGVVPAAAAARRARSEFPQTVPAKLDQSPTPAPATSPQPTTPATISALPASDRSQTNIATGSRPSTPRMDYTVFKIIADRNIFDPNRVPHRPNAPRPQPKVTESFALVGTMSYAKGNFAFFNGSSSGYRKALKSTDTIAGYTVMDIEPDGVTLAAGTNQVQLRIGMSLRRQEGGEWLVATGTEAYAASTTARPPSSGPATESATSQPGASSGGDMSELEKRMMQRREQQ